MTDTSPRLAFCVWPPDPLDEVLRAAHKAAGIRGYVLAERRADGSWRLTARAAPREVVRHRVEGL